MNTLAKHFLKGALMVWLLLMGSLASASHIRSTDIQWSVPDPVASPLTVRIIVTMVARSSYYGPGLATDEITIALTGPGVSAASLVALAQVGNGVDAMNAPPSYDGNYRVMRGELTYTFPALGTYSAAATACCRGSNLANGNNDRPWRVEAKMVLDGQRSGPLAAAQPILNMTRGSIQTVSFPMLDPDGDAVTCRFATAAESGGLPNPIPTDHGKVATLSSSNNICTLTWDLSLATANSFHVLPVVLESTHNGAVSTASIDRYVIVTDKPFPTCTGGGQVALLPNQNFSTSFTATSAAPVTFANVIGMPAAATLTPAVGTTAPSPMTVVMDWTPGLADAGTNFMVQAVFRNAAQVEGYCNYVINVDAANPSVGLDATVDVSPGTAPLLAGTVGNATNATVDIVLTDSLGGTHALVASAPAGTWQVTGPSNLPIGLVSVSASLRGFSVLPATGNFRVLTPVIAMDLIADVALGTAAQMRGTVSDLATGMLDIVLTDSQGVVYPLQAPLISGVWQLSSPVSLPGGLVGVSANLPGLGLVAVTGQFRVLVAAPAAAPVPVPVDAGCALALLGTLMGGVAWRRSKRSTPTAS